MYDESFFVFVDCNIGNDGFIQLINMLFNNENIMLKELYLAGNQITANQISALVSLFHIDVSRSYYDQLRSPTDQQHYIFSKLQIFDLNGTTSYLFVLRIDNRLGSEGVEYLFSLITNNVFPDIRKIFLLSKLFSFL